MEKKIGKKLIIFTVLITILTISIAYGIVFLFDKKKDETMPNELLSVIKNYDENKSLSFENYLTNTLNTPVSKDNEKYYFVYNKKNVCVSQSEVLSIENIKTNEGLAFSFESMEDLKNCKELKVGDKIYLKSYYKSNYKGAGIYDVVENNSDNDICVELENGLFAKLEIKNSAVSVNQLGAYGNGSQDDSNAINNAIILCKEKNIQNLTFENGTYLANDYINIFEIDGLKILGNNSTILVTDNFKNSDSGEFFFNVYKSSNILINSLIIKYDFSKTMRGIRTQMVLNTTTNIEIFHCEFLIEKSMRETSECGYTNFDCYSNWHNVIINNCHFVNLCDNEDGGGIWIRDLHGKGSDNIKVIQSEFYKIAHDEILAVFMGKIKDVLISGNTFTVEDDGESSSVMNFTLGSGSSSQAENITFEHNKIKTCSTGGLIWSKNTKNLVIKNNEISIILSKKADRTNTNNHFRVFEALANSNGELSKIELIENNVINVYSNIQNYLFQFKIFNNVKNVYNNNINIHTPVTNIFINCDNVTNNSVNSNSSVEFVSYNTTQKFNENNISISARTNCMFRWYGFSLENEITCKSNQINILFADTEDCCVVMINGSKLNNNLIKFETNTINAISTGKNSRILFVAPDDDNQQFYFKNNSITGFPENKNYIKNTTII